MRIVRASITPVTILTGWSEQEVVGQSCRQLTGGVHCEDCPLLGTAETGTVRGEECAIYTKSGDKRFVLKNTSPIRDESLCHSQAK